MVMQIDPTQGLLVRHPGKLSQPTISIDYDLIHYLQVSPDTDVLRCITIRLQNTAQQGLEFLIDKDDIGDLILYISGYCQVLHHRDIRVEYSSEPSDDFSIGHQAPPYEGTHFVYPAGWNYSSEMKTGIEVMVNFAHGPPPYNQAIGTSTLYDDTTADTAMPAPTERVFSPIQHPACNGEKSGRRRSLDLSRYVDESSPVDSSLEKLTNLEESPLRRRSKLLTVTESLLVKSRSLSPRFRDSIRIYKQRFVTSFFFYWLIISGILFLMALQYRLRGFFVDCLRQVILIAANLPW